MFSQTGLNAAGLTPVAGWENYRGSVECGGCEKPDADILWYTTYSNAAHSVCYEEIKDVEADLNATIDAVYKDNFDKNMAHVAAVRAVKQELGGVSIKTFLETNGADKLKAIFNSTGIAAAKAYSSKY